jgi:aryl-alcohol dehydrogenase-like predicted oxidoreductase
MAGLMKLQEQEKIKNIGLCNFDTEHMLDLINEDAPIVSNQVSFSILDTRPLEKMVPASLKHDVKLLTYGGLLGGFISSYWKGKPEPIFDTLTNVSLRKYLPWIQYWGGWKLFQELLTVLDKIAVKHSVSISNVAIRWVLDQPAVGGVIVGVRFGLSDHIKDNIQTFSLKLDDEDINAIKVVQSKGNNLYSVFGDTGNEYHRRRG